MRDRKSGLTTPRMPRVLVYSPVTVVNSVLMRIVHSCGYEVAEANSPEDISERCIQDGADIVMVDDCPDKRFDGLLCLRELYNIRFSRLSGQRFGLIVGVGGGEKLLASFGWAHNQPLRAVLQKPYDADKVAEALRRVAREVFSPSQGLQH